MFCPLERIELKTNHCPAQSCLYKSQANSCLHDELTSDDVSPQVIAEAKNIKVYKAKQEIAEAKANISIGVTALQYAEFIKLSFPNIGAVDRLYSSQTVNGLEDRISQVLLNVFGLSQYQQQKFWEEQRFTSWSKRLQVTLTLKDIKATIAATLLPTTS